MIPPPKLFFSFGMRLFSSTFDGSCVGGSHAVGREHKVELILGSTVVVLPEESGSPSLWVSFTSFASPLMSFDFPSCSGLFRLLLCHDKVRRKFCHQRKSSTLPQAPCDPYPPLPPSDVRGAHALSQPQSQDCL